MPRHRGEAAGISWLHPSEVAVWWLPPNCPSLSSQVEMATARDLGEVTVLGSLLLQHLLHFSRPCLILQSLSALTGPQLLTLAQSPAGSHVLDAVLTSPSVTRKQRRRVLKLLKVRFLAPVLIPLLSLHLESVCFPRDGPSVTERMRNS